MALCTDPLKLAKGKCLVRIRGSTPQKLASKSRQPFSFVCDDASLGVLISYAVDGLSNVDYKFTFEMKYG